MSDRDLDLKIVIAVSRSYHLLFEKIGHNIMSFGLNPTEFGVLELLLHKGPQPVQKVAEKILVTSGTMTYVIDKLVEKGWVIRKKCTQDKRIYYVSLTDLGQEFIADVFPKHHAFLNELLGTIDPQVKTELLASLKVLYQNIWRT